jgi:hypothetical protein
MRNFCGSGLLLSALFPMAMLVPLQAAAQPLGAENSAAACSDHYDIDKAAVAVKEELIPRRSR